jgi:hypothetical protein
MNIPIWPGSSSFAQVSASYYNTPSSGIPPTPFGFYDNETQFKTDADSVAMFVTRRLGYPIMDIELQDINIYAAFEEAVTTYGNELYAFLTRDNYLTFEGASTSIDADNALITPSMANIVRLSEQYGEEAGSGGNVTWRKGRLTLIPGVQRYDLKAWAESQGIVGGIEIKRVFYQPPPAVSQMFAPFLGTMAGGLGGVPAAGAYGLGMGYTNYLMMPTSFTAQTIQAIEMQNTITLSNYTFEITNNVISVFPVPGTGFFNEEMDNNLDYGMYLNFEYVSLQERLDSAFGDGTNKITNTSNVPYTNPNYNALNSVGRSWIYEYTLALTKEILGYVRGKYSTVPIPNAEVTLNQQDLLSSATATKDALILRLREYFDQTSRQALLERRAAESAARVTEINQVPMVIYIA